MNFVKLNSSFPGPQEVHVGPIPADVDPGELVSGRGPSSRSGFQKCPYQRGCFGPDDPATVKIGKFLNMIRFKSFLKFVGHHPPSLLSIHQKFRSLNSVTFFRTRHNLTQRHLNQGSGLEVRASMLGAWFFTGVHLACGEQFFPKLKGSIGEGSSDSNFSGPESSVSIRSKFKIFC